METPEERNSSLVVPSRVAEFKNCPVTTSSSDLHENIGAHVLRATTVTEDAHEHRRVGTGRGSGGVRVARVLRIQVWIAIQTVDLPAGARLRGGVDAKPANELWIEGERAASCRLHDHIAASRVRGAWEVPVIEVLDHSACGVRLRSRLHGLRAEGRTDKQESSNSPSEQWHRK